MVRNSLKQTGSTHVIIIVILVIALLGALGFVFWNNFMRKDSSQPVATNNQNISQSDTSTDADKDYLKIEDWKVKFKLTQGASEVTYYEVPAVSDYVKAGYDAKQFEFSTKAVEDLGENCIYSEDGNVVTRLATLRRSKEKIADGPIVNNGQPVGGYYYYVVGAQSSCSTVGTDVQIKNRADVVELLKNPIAY